MSEWWTYTLSDFLLFSPQTYQRLIELYQRDVWPLQIPMLALGCVIAAMALRGDRSAGRIAGLILAAAWMGVAWAFHLQRYATINWAAPWFGAAFVVEAALLAWRGALARPLSLGPPRTIVDWTGVALLLFALLGEPLLGRALGRSWFQVEVFGITPDATAMATLGVLLLARRPALMAIPVLWCLVTGALLWAMEAPDALVPPIVALAALALALRRRRAQVANRPAW
jgi:hypothetical protein